MAGRGDGLGAKSYDGEKAWFLINHSILSEILDIQGRKVIGVCLCIIVMFLDRIKTCCTLTYSKSLTGDRNLIEYTVLYKKLK
jgi:hypothetical protein